MKTEVGRVSEQERDEIQALFERKNGLNELAKILTADNTDLYNRLVADMGTTSTRFQMWWNEMSQKYHWPSKPDAHWEIDFVSCKIYIITPDHN